MFSNQNQNNELLYSTCKFKGPEQLQDLFRFFEKNAIFSLNFYSRNCFSDIKQGAIYKEAPMSAVAKVPTGGKLNVARNADPSIK